MSQFTLSIDENPEVEVPVNFTIKQGGVDKKHAFTLLATRMSHEEQDEHMKAVDFNYRLGLQSMDVITGWKGQRLVLDADKKPAEFSPEALDCMLSAPGVAGIIFVQYVKECNAKAKN